MEALCEADLRNAIEKEFRFRDLFKQLGMMLQI